MPSSTPSASGHRIEPHAYLKDVLTRLPAMTNRDDLATLVLVGAR